MKLQSHMSTNLPTIVAKLNKVEQYFQVTVLNLIGKSQIHSLTLEN